MRDLSKLEKQLAEMAEMDRVLQASATMVKSIESAAAIGRQLHESAKIVTMERSIQASMFTQSMQWAKNAAHTRDFLQSAADTRQNVARASMIFHAEDRIGVRFAMDAFLQSERPFREAMMEIEKRRALIEEVAKHAEASRVMRNAAAHHELTVQENVDQPLSKPLVVDVKKNLEALAQAKTDGQDLNEQCGPKAESELPDFASRHSHPPGTCMIEIAEAVFSVQDVERVFEPLVADYRMEMDQALRAGDIAKQCALRGEYEKQFVYTIVQVAWSVFARVFKAVRGS